MKIEDHVNIKSNLQSVKSKILKNISDKDIFNPSNEFERRRQLLNDIKEFKGQINGTCVSLISKRIKYWPRTKLELIEISENETRIIVKYQLYYFYLIFYSFLVVSFGFQFFDRLKVNHYELNERGIEMLTIFIIILVIIPILARWTQKNLIKFLKE